MDTIVHAFTILAFALVMGVRHGFDFDHIAAISDITSTQAKVNHGLFYATLYALGHILMVVILGLVALSLGQRLPASVDKIFKPIVGLTLILLGLYVIFSLVRYGSNFKMRSRFMLSLSAIKFIYHRLLHKFSLSHNHPKLKQERYGSKTSFLVGMIHGVGAETPTQIAAFAALVGFGGGIRGVLFLLLFVTGIFISNLSVAFLSAFSYLKTKYNSKIYITLGILTATFSLVVGAIFLLGK